MNGSGVKVDPRQAISEIAPRPDASALSPKQQEMMLMLLQELEADDGMQPISPLRNQQLSSDVMQE